LFEPFTYRALTLPFHDSPYLTYLCKRWHDNIGDILLTTRICGCKCGSVHSNIPFWQAGRWVGVRQPFQAWACGPQVPPVVVEEGVVGSGGRSDLALCVTVAGKTCGANAPR